MMNLNLQGFENLGDFAFLLTADSPFDFLSGILAGIGVGLIFKTLRFRQKKKR